MMVHREHQQKGKAMDTFTNAETAGEKALAEMREAVTNLLALLNREPDTYNPNNDQDLTYEETVTEEFDALVRQYEGSYWYNGREGWKAALEHPNTKPFDYNEWR